MTELATTNVRRYLDLSTGHLTRTEAEVLDFLTRRDRDDEPWIVVPHGYGAWVHVDPDPGAIDEFIEADDEFAHRWASMIECMRAALALGCLWINFDADADRMEGLPVYDW